MRTKSLNTVSKVRRADSKKVVISPQIRIQKIDPETDVCIGAGFINLAPSKVIFTAFTKPEHSEHVPDPAGNIFK